jgi:hypothetical protein
VQTANKSRWILVKYHRDFSMFRDESGSDQFTTSISMFFCRIWSGADITRMRFFPDVGYGAESDQLRSGCGLI